MRGGRSRRSKSISSPTPDIIGNMGYSSVAGTTSTDIEFPYLLPPASSSNPRDGDNTVPSRAVVVPGVATDPLSTVRNQLDPIRSTSCPGQSMSENLGQQQQQQQQFCWQPPPSQQTHIATGSSPLPSLSGFVTRSDDWKGKSHAYLSARSATPSAAVSPTASASSTQRRGAVPGTTPLQTFNSLPGIYSALKAASLHQHTRGSTGEPASTPTLAPSDAHLDSHLYLDRLGTLPDTGSYDRTPVTDLSLLGCSSPSSMITCRSTALPSGAVLRYPRSHVVPHKFDPYEVAFGNSVSAASVAADFTDIMGASWLDPPNRTLSNQPVVTAASFHFKSPSHAEERDVPIASFDYDRNSHHRVLEPHQQPPPVPAFSPGLRPQTLAGMGKAMSCFGSSGLSTSELPDCGRTVSYPLSSPPPPTPLLQSASAAAVARDLFEDEEEIAELEGELSTSEEEEETVAITEMTASKTSSEPTDPLTGRGGVSLFEGINFTQLFSVSAEHSERVIGLAKQFCPQLKECLLRSFSQTSQEVGAVTGVTDGHSGTLSMDIPAESANGSGGGGCLDDGRSDISGDTSRPMDSLLESILCKLSCMIESYLFHLVDWMNRTELFRVIPVEDKMKLLNSGWSEVIVIEFLQCVLLHFRDGLPDDSSSTEKTNGVRNPEEPSNPDIYSLVNQLIAYLLDSSESNHRIYDLIARFASLQLSSHEFTCLKFLAIFNPHKHDVHLSSSYDYVREVQAEICHYLLRSARRASKRRGHAASLGLTRPHELLAASLATAAASERLGQLLLRLSEVKHVAFQMENFLLSRYWAGNIPHETLLTEMLLTKRGGLSAVNSGGGGASTQRPTVSGWVSPSDMQDQQQQQRQQLPTSHSNGLLSSTSPVQRESLGGQTGGSLPTPSHLHHRQQQLQPTVCSASSSVCPQPAPIPFSNKCDSDPKVSPVPSWTYSPTTTQLSQQQQNYFPPASEGSSTNSGGSGEGSCRGGHYGLDPILGAGTARDPRLFPRMGEAMVGRTQDQSFFSRLGVSSNPTSRPLLFRGSNSPSPAMANTPVL
ncbi:hypothetical protein AAHC03_01675 [Spirometra sp. Aus1]